MTGHSETATVYTHCRICVATCGLAVTVDRANNQVLDIAPDRDNPYTWRDFCRKGKTADEVIAHPQRITTPMRRVGDRYEPATYAEAIADIAARLNAIIETCGADAVGSYQGNPMSFSFDSAAFYTGLLDAIGTRNRFCFNSIDEDSTHVVCQELYGIEVLPLAPDIDNCDCFLLMGMDPAHSRFNWLDNCPDGWNRVLQRKAHGADVIVVDPRRSESAAAANTHVSILPGGDWAFLLGIIKVIFDNGWEHPSTCLPLTGLDAIRELAVHADRSGLSELCGVPEDVIADVARRFGTARTAACVSHTGVAHNLHGTLGEWLAHVLNLITDRIDQPGGRRYERGYVNLEALMAAFASESEHLTRLRKTRPILGFHPLAELPDEITTPGNGQIRALFIAFGNPVVSGPQGAKLDAAMEELDLLVAIDLVQRESHRNADWLIPGTHWLERGGLHPLLGSIQERPYAHYADRAVAPPEGVLAEWEFFTDLALAMNRNLFGKPSVNKLVRASRTLARWTGRPGLALNPEWLQRLLVLTGRRITWKAVRNAPHGLLYDKPRYGDLAGKLATPGKRVNVAPPRFVAATKEALATSRVTKTSEFPLVMINKRLRESMNSWLNESPGLFQENRGNTVDVHPDDAALAGVADGDLARLVSAVDTVEVRVRVTSRLRPGVVCVPHGWGGRVFNPATGEAGTQIGANRNLLVDNTQLDAFSHVPIFNSTPVRLEAMGTSTPPATGPTIDQVA